jgi:hypothetical protein
VIVKHRSGTRWSDDREVKWCCVRSASCTRRRGTRVSWFGLKTKIDGLSVDFLIWASRPEATVWWFGPQNYHDGFLVLALKPSGLQFICCATKSTEDEDGVGHASRSSGLLRLEASRARVSMSSLKTGGGTARMVHVASSQRLRWVEAEDGRVNAMRYIRPFYPNFVVFIILGPKSV